MASQRGSDFLLKLDETGGGAFVTVAGLRATRFRLSAAAVDVTDAESPGRWRELLAGAGLRHASLAGHGLFRDGASDAAVARVFFGSVLCAWQIVIPHFGILAGAFQVVTLDYAGEHAGELEFAIALESAGALAFTAT